MKPWCSCTYVKHMHTCVHNLYLKTAYGERCVYIIYTLYLKTAYGERRVYIIYTLKTAW